MFNTGAPIITEFALIYPILDRGGSPRRQRDRVADSAVSHDRSRPRHARLPRRQLRRHGVHTEGLGDISQVIRYTLADAPSQAGDFDDDQDVDGADFLFWQRELGGDSRCRRLSPTGSPASEPAASHRALPSIAS